MNHSLLRLSVALAVIVPSLVFTLTAAAHPFAYGALNTELTAEGNILRLKTEVPQTISYGALDEKNQHGLFELAFKNQFTVSQSGIPCPFTLETFDNVNTPDKTFFNGFFSCPTPPKEPQDLHVHVNLFNDYFQNFDHFVTLVIGENRWELAFRPAHEDYPESVAASYLGVPLDYYLAVAGQFLWLGLLHIWTGYDHILFLLSVILLTRSPKNILILVTSFTLAHSVTLLLAGFHIVEISPNIVEPLIALTIAYMAIRNLMNLRMESGETALSERWVTTFGFGLIHGLGFAGVLSETSIPQAFFVPALLIFNLGIEIGQLALLLIAIPLLFWVDRLAFRKRILATLSMLVALIALFWFFERIFF